MHSAPNVAPRPGRGDLRRLDERQIRFPRTMILMSLVATAIVHGADETRHSLLPSRYLTRLARGPDVIWDRKVSSRLQTRVEEKEATC